MVVISKRLYPPSPTNWVRIGGDAKRYGFSEEGSAVEKAEPCRTNTGATRPRSSLCVESKRPMRRWLFGGSIRQRTDNRSVRWFRAALQAALGYRGWVHAA